MKTRKKLNLKENITSVFKRFPVVLSSTYIVGVLLIILNHVKRIDENEIMKIVMIMAIFAINALILKIAYEQYEGFTKKRYLLLMGVNILFSVVYYLFLFDYDYIWSMIRYAIIIFAQILLFLGIGFIKSDDKVEHFTNLIALRLAISWLIYLITVGGIFGLIFAINRLLGLNIADEAFTDIAIVLGTTFLPMLWLFGIDCNVKETIVKLYKVLIAYVLMPLLLAYSAVVYSYIFKIAFNGFKLPNSIIGNLVIWYSFVGVVVLFLSRPYKSTGIVKFFHKYYSLISIAPITIMFFAIAIRISYYGVTIKRFLFVAGGIWIALVFAYFILTNILKKKRYNIALVISLALVAIICAVFANMASNTSQINILTELIEDNKTNGVLQIDSMSDPDKEKIQNIVYYLEDYDNSDRLEKLLSEEEINKFYNASFENSFNNRVHKYDGENPNVIDVKDYNYLVDIDYYSYEEKIFDGYIIIIDNNDGNEIRVKYNDEEILGVYLEDLYSEKIMLKEEDFGDESLDYIAEYSNDTIAIKIILENLTYYYDDNGELIIEGYSGVMLLK